MIRVIGWPRLYREEKPYKCIVCGIATNKEQCITCKNEHCKMTLKITAKKIVREDFELPNVYNAINYRIGRHYNPVSFTYKGVSVYWWVLPEERIVKEKYLEVIAKDYLLKRTSKNEFIRRFINEMDNQMCLPCNFNINTISYEKLRNFIDT